MMQVGILQSVQVGKPEWHQISDGVEKAKRWKTSFFRTPNSQPRRLYSTHLEGNEQADKKHHGSLNQAVLLYAAQHYPVWQVELGCPEMGPGGFGENFTVEGLSEQTVCVGDTYAIGEARIQVSEPRYPCWKIERRWGIAGLTDRAAATGRTGWYCRVVQEGMIQPGAPISLVECLYPDWTIALINDFVYSRNHDAEKARALAACPLLNAFWQQLIVKRVKGIE